LRVSYPPPRLTAHSFVPPVCFAWTPLVALKDQSQMALIIPSNWSDSPN